MIGLLFAAVTGVKWPSGSRERNGAQYPWFTWSDSAHEIRIEEGQPGCGHIEGECCKEKETFPVGEVSDFIPPREEVIT